MDNFFIFCENIHNIQNFQMMSYENKETVRYGQETIEFRTPSLWGKPEFWAQLLYSGIKTLNTGRWALDNGHFCYSDSA